MDTSRSSNKRYSLSILPDAPRRDLARQGTTIKTLPAVAMSSFCSASDFEQRCYTGFYAHVTRPLDFQILGDRYLEKVKIAR